MSKRENEVPGADDWISQIQNPTRNQPPVAPRPAGGVAPVQEPPPRGRRRRRRGAPPLASGTDVANSPIVRQGEALRAAGIRAPEVNIPQRLFDPYAMLVDAAATARPMAADAAPAARPSRVLTPRRTTPAATIGPDTREPVQRRRDEEREAERQRLERRPSAVRKLDSFAAGGAQSLTLGYRDELMGALSPTSTEQDFEERERLRRDAATGGDKVAGVLGAITGAALPIGMQNALLARSARFAPEGTAARSALESFGAAGARTRMGDAARGVAEGLPYDMAYGYEDGESRGTNLAIGAVAGGLAGGLLRPGGGAARAGDEGVEGFVRPSSRKVRRGDGLTGYGVDRVSSVTAGGDEAVRGFPGATAPGAREEVPEWLQDLERGQALRTRSAGGQARIQQPRGNQPQTPPETPVTVARDEQAPSGIYGRETQAAFPDGGQVRARYRLMEADEVQPSHDPMNFQRNAAYPEGVQGRDYHRDTATQERVAERTIGFDPERLLDPTGLVVSGPPLVTPAGVAVAGNERAMLRRRVPDMNPVADARYRAALSERAESFGLDPQQVQGMRQPMLVREIVPDEGMDLADPNTLRSLNTRSDQEVGKAKDLLSDAATRARGLREGRALDHFASTFDGTGTLRHYLVGPQGRKFVQEMVADGVIPRAEMPRFVNPQTGVLNAEGMNLVERMMQFAAVPDSDIIAAAPPFLLGKIEGAAPYVAQASRVPGWDLGPMLRDALRFHVEAQGKGVRVGDMLDNTELFGREGELGAEALARFLDQASVKQVRDLFADYSRQADAARRATDSVDLFGYTPPTPGQAGAQSMRQALVDRVGAVGDAGQMARLRQTTSPEFRRWFGDSKVVDGQGQPLVVYHGTKESFDRFSLKSFGASDEGLTGKGFHFTYNPEEASGYALNEQFGKGNAPNVMPAYVSLQNPLIFTNGVLPDGRTIRDFHQGGINSRGGNAIRKLADDAGHDGIVFASREGKIGHAIAFRPEQIKSATGNSGAFDPSNPNITGASQTALLDLIARTGLGAAAGGAIGGTLDSENPLRGAAIGAAAGAGLGVGSMRGAMGADAATAGRRRAGLDLADELRTRPRSETGFVSTNADEMATATPATTQRQRTGMPLRTGPAYNVDPLRIPDMDGIADAGRSAMRPLQNQFGAVGDISRLRTPAGTPKFYSRLERAIQGGQNAAPATQWLSYLDGHPGGIAKGEREWTGVDEWLRQQGGRKVTRQELEQYLAENRVQVGEVVLGGPNPQYVVRPNGMGKWELYNPLTGDIQGQGLSWDDAVNMGLDINRNIPRRVEPRFSDFQVPGGEEGTYREVLLTLGKKPRPDVAAQRAELKRADERIGRATPGSAEWDAAVAESRALRARLNETTGDAYGNPTSSSGSGRPLDEYKSPHWDESNVLAHIRMDDRTLENGERVLFVQEVQSDWHQAGREKGYATGDREQKFEITRNGAFESHWSSREEAEREVARLQSAFPNRQGYAVEESRVFDQPKGVPNAPFKNTDEWLGLAMKRIIDEASENGYDRVAWATGEQISRAVGAEGGGNAEFYGKIIPQWVKKYGKKVGVEVEALRLPADESEYYRSEWAGPELTDEVVRDLASRADTWERQALENLLRTTNDPQQRAHAMVALMEQQRFRSDMEWMMGVSDGALVRKVRDENVVGENLSFRITPALRQSVETSGQALHSFPGPILDALKTQAGQVAAGSGLGLAMEPDHPFYGALAGAAAALGIRKGFLFTSGRKLRSAVRRGRAQEVLSQFTDDQLEQLAKRYDRLVPEASTALRGEVDERAARRTLPPEQLADRALEQLATAGPLRPVRERVGRALLAPEQAAIVDTYRAGDVHLRRRILDELEAATDEAPAVAERSYARMIAGLEMEGFRALPNTPNPAIDAGRYANLAGFALDSTGEKRLAAHVQRIVEVEGLDPKQRVTWEETRAAARELGLEPEDVSALAKREGVRLSAPELLAVRNQVRENVQGIEQAARKLAQMEGLETAEAAVERQILRQGMEAAEAQNTLLLSRFVRERSAAGRDLNALKILAHQTMDPVVWRERAVRALRERGVEFQEAVHGKRIEEIIASCG